MPSCTGCMPPESVHSVCMEGPVPFAARLAMPQTRPSTPSLPKRAEAASYLDCRCASGHSAALRGPGREITHKLRWNQDERVVRGGGVANAARAAAPLHGARLDDVGIPREAVGTRLRRDRHPPGHRRRRGYCRCCGRVQSQVSQLGSMPFWSRTSKMKSRQVSLGCQTVFMSALASAMGMSSLSTR